MARARNAVPAMLQRIDQLVIPGLKTTVGDHGGSRCFLCGGSLT
jgi:hypothetical protein